MEPARHGVFFSPPAVDLTNLENATAAIPPRVRHVHGSTLAFESVINTTAMIPYSQKARLERMSEYAFQDQNLKRSDYLNGSGCR